MDIDGIMPEGRNRQNDKIHFFFGLLLRQHCVFMCVKIPGLKILEEAFK